MAHFAKIENGIVTNVIVVDNEHEADGEAYLNSIGLEGTWIQTSYNHNIRAKYAGIGDVYDESDDTFKPAKPQDDAIWNAETWSWDTPEPTA